jgi:guanosine-3',5'-bis(diphosphate) 3'-pyrophosphohydrolase
MIVKAIAFANEKHAGQFRKGKQTPYILHVLEAGIIVSQIKYDEELIAAAILHDLVEDTEVTLETIAEEFGARVAELVATQTEDKSLSWHARKKHTVDTLPNAPFDVKLLTLADKLSNARSLYRDYLEVGDELWERFNMKDKQQQGMYYKGLVDGLAELAYLNEYQEFRSLVEKLFN